MTARQPVTATRDPAHVRAGEAEAAGAAAATDRAAAGTAAGRSADEGQGPAAPAARGVRPATEFRSDDSPRPPEFRSDDSRDDAPRPSAWPPPRRPPAGTAPPPTPPCGTCWSRTWAASPWQRPRTPRCSAGRPSCDSWRTTVRGGSCGEASRPGEPPGREVPAGFRPTAREATTPPSECPLRGVRTSRPSCLPASLNRRPCRSPSGRRAGRQEGSSPCLPGPRPTGSLALTDRSNRGQRVVGY